MTLSYGGITPVYDINNSFSPRTLGHIGNLGHD